ncbi:MAG TPA: hypothetical protein VFG45_07640 [Candidatus Nitrosocosmicus sp.]|nr:hypothetical protein [Candidatus Nitrosocosmicus sp.]
MIVLLGTFALACMFTSFEGMAVFVQKLVPTPVTNTTNQNFNQSIYPVFNRLVNDTPAMNQGKSITNSVQKDTVKSILKKY